MDLFAFAPLAFLLEREGYRVTVVDVKKATQKTVPYKEMERYCRDRTDSPLK